MREQSMQLIAGSALVLLVIGGSATALADDASKRALALAKCAAAYKVALTACESQAQAATCYQQADATDLACRRAQGAAGNSEVETSFIERRRTVLDKLNVVKLPLNCGTGLNATCADGHARFPTCARSGEQAINAGQGISGQDPGITRDAQGTTDLCSGQTLKCPAGFTLSSRTGQDLCWDSVANRDRYAY
jgi:hypothetical protein